MNIAVFLPNWVGDVAMDLGTLEDIDLNTLGGADTVNVNDQSATDLFTINLDLQGTAGTGDGQPDAITINGTDGDDVGPYDYGSIMHYPATAFSKNGQPTIVTKNGATIGQRQGLSPGDIAAVQSMYP